MLKETEPFKTVLSVLKFCGFWETKTISKFHAFCGFFAYFIFEPFGLLLTAMSILQIESFIDYAKYFTFVCLFIMANSFVISFCLLKEKFNELFNDISETFAAKNSANVNLNEVCITLSKNKLRKTIANLVCFTLGAIGSFVTKTSIIPMYRPEFTSEIPGFFYISWIYQSLTIYYIGLVSTIFEDMFFDTLNAINAFSNYFVAELKGLDLVEINAKERLEDCIKMHRNIQRLVWKFTKIVCYPISFQMTITGYLLCTTVFTINNNDGQAGFLIGLSALILVQILEPCMISQKIETASEGYANTLLECNWIESDVKTKKLFLFFLKNLMFPTLKFNLFGMIDVNLKTFLRIFNATYSAYAVLNNS